MTTWTPRPYFLVPCPLRMLDCAVLVQMVMLYPRVEFTASAWWRSAS